jgi:lipopolysaccharide assembly outer membrane protein LptD (OstA)
MTFGYSHGKTFLSYTGYLNSQNLKIDREDLLTVATLQMISFGISYGHRANQTNPNGKEQRQLSSLLDYRMSEKISSRIEITSNLELRQITSFKVGLAYEDNCYLTRLSLGKRRFENLFDRNDTSITFNFRIKG